MSRVLNKNCLDLKTSTISLRKKFPTAAHFSLSDSISSSFSMENMTSVAQGFTKSLAMTVLSEIGDKTFFAAAILAMRHPRRLVLSGCLSALIVMTIISAVVGWAAPNLISRTWTHHITTILFFGFGLWSLWDGFNDKGEAEDLAEVEAKLDADWKAAKGGGKDNDDLKKQRRKFLSQFFSPIFLKEKKPCFDLEADQFPIMRVLQAFSITFFGEWGDKSQIATIGLAADENPFGVVIGGIVGQALCTTAAVMGGKSLASQISEKIVILDPCIFLHGIFGMLFLHHVSQSIFDVDAVPFAIQVALSGGVLFIVFGILSFLSTVA
ncbi:hypothetical protein DKX38_012854 [Salix brachista]|uniref:GDT1 family protein n=1 Tax=Salix brachista TaxID=2182728 RepID=A0A5N5LQ57_9ROSI|nr:hypothetical protein DKX38_012854 [Salix brachista]